jgi:Zn-dependent protease with chaperone function
MHSRFFAALFGLVLLSTWVYAQQPTRNLKAEQVIWIKLAAAAPGAVEVFQRATAAMDKGDCRQAVQLYREVEKLVPEFSPALRRSGICFARLGQTEEALTQLEEAVKSERTPQNLINLAHILAYPARGKQGTKAQREVALTLAEEADEKYKGSDDPDYPLLVARLALDLRKEAEFRQATETLLVKYPNLMASHYFTAIRLGLDEDWTKAEDEIRKAERLGLPAQEVPRFLASGIRARATVWRWSHYVLYLFTAWACGLLLLLVTGKLFSKLTLHLIERADPNLAAGGAETALRRYYRRLINVAGSYYYFSIPFVIFLILAATGSIVYGFLRLGHIPIKLVLLLVFGAIVTVYKMVQSVFVRVKVEEPGRSLGLEEAPGLWTLTREVAENLGTRPLDEIRVTPGTEMAVFERGSYRERRNDRGRRILVLGLGLLPGFDQNPFRAVLAHEYGHLSHRDTAGGDVALRVNQDMMKFAHAMAVTGQAVWWNLGFQFLRLYYFLFRRISHGATRLQEVLADRVSAQNFGAQTFEVGLRHVIRRNIEFSFLARNEIRKSLESRTALQNIYGLQVQQQKSLEDAIDKEIDHQTSEDDTHPSPVDRFRLLSRVVCKNQLARSGPVWDLFANREGITKEMSSEIEKMARGGVISEDSHVTTQQG